MDELIAWAQIPIPQAVIAAGETHDEWYPLNGKQGDGQEGMVNLVFSYTVSIVRPTADMCTIRWQYKINVQIEGL